MNKAECSVPRQFIKNSDELGVTEQRRLVLSAAEHGLHRVHPCNAVPETLKSLEGVLGDRPVYVAGLGKAAYTMAQAVLSTIPERVEAGLVVTPRGFPSSLGPIEVHHSDHPLPSQRSVEAAEKLIEFLQSVPPSAALLFLVSGGGSALVEKPCTAGIEEVAELTRELMKRGANIYELNTVRSLLSCTKAGGLLSYTRVDVLVNLVMSDVVGDNLCYIASGPTIPWCRPRLAEAENILKRYGLDKYIPLLRKAAEKRPAPRRDIHVVSKIVARNRDVLEAARDYLVSMGYRASVLTSRMRGEARQVAGLVAGIAEELGRREAVLLGGETTVTVRGRGVGGRNQELCLAILGATTSLGEEPGYTALCMGTDGVDGVSPVAGAIIDNIVAREAARKGLPITRYLDDNDSYRFFSVVRSTVDTGGHTGINVNDIVIILR